MKRIYLDNAAATPMHQTVIDAMLPFFSEEYHNPSALYKGARDAKNALEEARSSVAKLLGARPSEIIFTAGGTESANLAVHGVARAFPEAEVLVSAIEHDAVLQPAKQHNHAIVSVDQQGIIDITDLRKKIKDNTILVSVMLANNEIGTIQPIEEIAALISQIRHDRKKRDVELPIYLHTDAAQAPLYLDTHVARLGVDLMTLNGGKIHGPKQSGILYVKAGTILKPEIVGGGQEFGYRSGTENVAFVVGFAEALRKASKGRSERVKKTKEIRDYLSQKLEHDFNAEISGHRKHRIANNVHTIFPGLDNERALFALDELGVDVAAGSACSASSDVSSHVLLAIGKSDVQAQASIRFSLGQYTSKDEIDRLLELLPKALQA